MSTVLLVEDDPDNQLLLRTWLEGMGHQVRVYGSAVEALDDLPAHPRPDLAVLDVVLPQLTGIEFIEKLRQQPLFVDMPVVFLTAAELPPDPEQDWAPYAQYLTKPLSRATLAAAINNAFTAAQRSPGDTGPQRL
ncbi:response regulator [Kineosporia sp. J2-2]|uniref:Response regulator n=1 Tax=Kineosporia corallincola TaxID=2835133 RepID=A0ABS5TGD4_9ACTN|nr:response regulator [Kineosporia corallincola]MBT0770161.1 response regulator [Kineosporia corallincola]